MDKKFMFGAIFGISLLLGFGLLFSLATADSIEEGCRMNFKTKICEPRWVLNYNIPVEFKNKLLKSPPIINIIETTGVTPSTEIYYDESVLGFKEVKEKIYAYNEIRKEKDYSKFDFGLNHSILDCLPDEKIKGDYYRVYVVAGKIGLELNSGCVNG